MKIKRKGAEIKCPNCCSVLEVEPHEWKRELKKEAVPSEWQAALGSYVRFEGKYVLCPVCGAKVRSGEKKYL